MRPTPLLPHEFAAEDRAFSSFRAPPCGAERVQDVPGVWQTTNGGPELVEVLGELGMRDVLVLPERDRYTGSMADGIDSIKCADKGGALVEVQNRDFLDLAKPSNRRVLAFLPPLAEHERHRIVRRGNKGRAAVRCNDVLLQHSSWALSGWDLSPTARPLTRPTCSQKRQGWPPVVGRSFGFPRD